MKDPYINGRVMSLSSGFYEVMLEDGRQITCRPRGRLKKRRPESFREDIIAMGDNVKISLQSDKQGAIEDVEERATALIRSAPDSRGDYKQILLANPNQIVVVFSCAQPAPHLRMLDRFLVICERQKIPAVIAANKVDLVGEDAAKKVFSIYTTLGYRVIYTSPESGLGIEEFRTILIDKLSGLVGPSGVGKSSLLNAVQPELGLAVSHVSETTEKGRHTTVTRRLFPVNEGGFVADLPGIRMLSLWDIEPEELDAYFPEIRDVVADCQFNDCTHVSEPGCAVKAAITAGTIQQARYISYLRMRFGEDDDIQIESL
jgi:ribosome biogenesis GTPase